MAHGNKEVEIKVKVENAASLLAFLGKNAEFKSEERQVDEYFTPAHRNFLAERPVREWLRLRDENGKFSVNYKNWHFDSNGKTSSCDEFETRVEDSAKLRSLFAAIGIKPVVKVDKARRKWHYENYEIAVDSVEGLGEFVEIELRGSSADPKQVTDGMMDFLRQRGVGKIQRNYQGYPFLLLFPGEAKYYEEG